MPFILCVCACKDIPIQHTQKAVGLRGKFFLAFSESSRVVPGLQMV